MKKSAQEDKKNVSRKHVYQLITSITPARWATFLFMNKTQMHVDTNTTTEYYQHWICYTFGSLIWRLACCCLLYNKKKRKIEEIKNDFAQKREASKSQHSLMK
ncbi:CLUMA_CG013214, isoform A [Clunio marinus]|uniref:CLUMA_CG013214, isoform A n=1 Tax=Clunio marinus TaxID=568069 RepID=A0A1J1II24_9DIPT|nr:CLUMA_CG013214, isoform A [Clunio marinus]